MPSIEKISPILGARIEGIDLSRPPEEESFRLIENALHEHGFVVLPGQTL
jgi:alpha-ketoglutarate-dependent taurine dioxygenase